MPAPRGAEVWRDFVTDMVPSSGLHRPSKADARAWSSWLESLVTSGVLSSGPWFATQSSMTLGYAANTIAVVYADPDAAKNGLYKKNGASGAGAWKQLTSFLPGYQFVTASPTGASTPNAIVAVTSPLLPAGGGVALVSLAIPATNTATPVTVAFDGGAALPIKDVAGADVVAGGLKAGMVVAGFVSGGVFRLITDYASAVHQAAAKEWANNAEGIPVSTAAGGDGSTTFSARHWAAKSDADADRSETARIGSETARNISVASAATAEAQANAAIQAAAASGDVAFFDTHAAASGALGTLPEQKIVRVFTDETRADAGTFYRVESGALVFKQYVETFQPELSGVPRRLYVQRMRDFVSVLDAMASGGLDVAVRNKEATDADAAEVTAAINNAQEDTAARGIGELFYPRGLYPVTYSANSLTHRCAVIGKSGVRHKGAGRGQTIIKLADGANCHMYVWRNGVDAGLVGVTIDGSAAGQSIVYDGTEGIAVGCFAEAERMTFRDLHIHDSPDYGIGVQVGTAIGLEIENVLVERAGSDGIDLKNTDDDSKENTLHRVTVRRFGLQGDATTENFAGVDIRGKVMANMIRVEGVGYGDVGNFGRTGIRLMAGEIDGAIFPGDVLGALQSILSDFFIEGIDGTTSALSNHVGLWARHRQTPIANGVIRLCGAGFIRSQRESPISNVVIDTCKVGFRSVISETNNGLPLLTQPDRDTITALQVRGCTEVGVDIRSDASTFLGLMARGNAQNLNISSGADGNRFIGGSISAPTGATNFANSGANTVFRNVEGIVNEIDAQSAQFAIDSTGVKEVLIPHGMSMQPLASAVTLTLLTSSPSTDFVIAWMRIKSVDSINVTVEVRVTTASATVGSVARVGMKASRFAF